MNAYDIGRSAIQVAPFLLVPALMYAFRRAPKPVRLIAVVGLGWIGVFFLIRLYWSFSIDRAPTRQLAEDLATRDGAPIAFASVFGWLYVAVYMALIEAVRWIVLWTRRRLESSRAV